MLLLLLSTLTFASTSLPCNSQSVSSFESFWKNVYVENKIDRARLEHYTKCMNLQTSLKKAQEKEAERRKRFSERGIQGEPSDTIPKAVSSRYENEILIYNTAFNSLSGVDLSNEASRQQFRARTQALYRYFEALNTCISEDLDRSLNPNRIELMCSSASDLQQKRKELAAAIPAATDQRTRPNPAPKLVDLKTTLACQKVLLLEENRRTVSCNARAYCMTYTSSNPPVLKGTALSSVAADADFSRTNLALIDGCDRVSPTPLCKANYYRHESSTPQNRQFILGNRPEGIIGSAVGFFTQKSCDYKADGFIIPRIANEYEDGNQFYDLTNSQQPNCSLNWDKYTLAYKRALIREFELETSYLDCDGVQLGNSRQQQRRSNPSGGGQY